MPAPSADRIRDVAHAAGFDLVRFGPAGPGPDGARFAAWLDAGRAGEMDYLARNRDRILDPQRYLPGAHSAINVAVDYGRGPVALEGGGRIARYAAGRDYHRYLGKGLQRLRRDLEAAGMPRGSLRGGTDAVPVLERALSAQAGIGFLAKSAMVISPERGPYLLLGELLTDRDLPWDGPAPGTCGTCTACLDACPTDAIVAPFEVDARRCLSYTTIELRGSIPEPLREAQGDRLFGCDDCLEVCPFTRHSRTRRVPEPDLPPDLQRHTALETWSLVGLLDLDEEQWNTEWTGTAIRRATRSGLRRNAAVVLGNLRETAALEGLTRCLSDPDAVVRAHAAWALGRIDGGGRVLRDALPREREATVRDEIEQALART